MGFARIGVSVAKGCSMRNACMGPNPHELARVQVRFVASQVCSPG